MDQCFQLLYGPRPGPYAVLQLRHLLLSAKGTPEGHEVPPALRAQALPGLEQMLLRAQMLSISSGQILPRALLPRGGWGLLPRPL